jgi:hypothetical protein
MIMNKKLGGDIGQWCGLVASSLALIIESIDRGPVPIILASSGAILWGVATKIKYYGGKNAKIQMPHGNRPLAPRRKCPQVNKDKRSILAAPTHIVNFAPSRRK